MMYRIPTLLVRFEDRHPSRPPCGKSMIGDPIPKDRQHHYGANPHFIRRIGFTDPANGSHAGGVPGLRETVPAEIEAPNYS
jgi:hypothetical protein